MFIDGKKFKDTQGPWGLLTKSKPDRILVRLKDKQAYKQLPLQSNAQSYNPSGKIKANKTNTRAVPKLMPPILLCWLTTSEANIVDMAVEVEPSSQYSVKFCCRATDDSRGAV